MAIFGGEIERPTNPWLAFFLAPVMVLIGSLVGAVALQFIPVADGALGFSIDLIAFFLPVAAIAWLWRTSAENGDLRSLGLAPESAVFRFGRGFLVGGLMFAAVVGILVGVGMMGTDSTPMDTTGAAALGGLAIAFIGWAVQATTEEVVARGWLMTTLAERSNVGLAVGASSLLFGLLHLFNENFSWLAMGNIVLVGVFLAIYALYERGVWGVAGIHTAWNMAQANLFGLEVSGQDLSFASLIDLEENGPGLMTGDAFGPEAGLAATGVIAAALLATWMVGRSSSADTTL